MEYRRKLIHLYIATSGVKSLGSSCDNCGTIFTCEHNLKRHQASRCKDGMVLNTFITKATHDVDY